jgi:hypothetical protein
MIITTLSTAFLGALSTCNGVCREQSLMQLQTAFCCNSVNLYLSVLQHKRFSTKQRHHPPKREVWTIFIVLVSCFCGANRETKAPEQPLQGIPEPNHVIFQHTGWAILHGCTSLVQDNTIATISSSIISSSSRVHALCCHVCSPAKHFWNRVIFLQGKLYVKNRRRLYD